MGRKTVIILEARVIRLEDEIIPITLETPTTTITPKATIIIIPGDPLIITTPVDPMILIMREAVETPKILIIQVDRMDLRILIIQAALKIRRIPITLEDQKILITQADRRILITQVGRRILIIPTIQIIPINHITRIIHTILVHLSEQNPKPILVSPSESCEETCQMLAQLQ